MCELVGMDEVRVGTPALYVDEWLDDERPTGRTRTAKVLRDLVRETRAANKRARRIALQRARIGERDTAHA